MKYAFLFALALLLAACAGTIPAEPDHTWARTSFQGMGLAVKAAAVTCTAAARADRIGGEELADLCVRRLIPARDALAFSVDALDPWTPEATAKFGCAAKAVRVALDALGTDFALRHIPTPNVMIDGERIGSWAERYADPRCDPLHPTTTVTVIPPSGLPPEQEPFQ